MMILRRALVALRPTVVLCVLFGALPLSLRAQGQAVGPIPYGGHHEFGIVSGYSPGSGPLFGYSQDVRYSPTTLRYSFLVRDGQNVQLRFAPELTALAILHETMPTLTNPNAPVTSFGAGFSPEGFQVVFLPKRRVQPFLSNAAGIIYYNQRVLSPGGSQFMFTIDFGAGVNLFTTRRNTVTVGYKYDHTSNANISEHNPGADSNVIYAGFSHFLTKGRK